MVSLQDVFTYVSSNWNDLKMTFHTLQKKIFFLLYEFRYVFLRGNSQKMIIDRLQNKNGFSLAGIRMCVFK